MGTRRNQPTRRLYLRQANGEYTQLGSIAEARGRLRDDDNYVIGVNGGRIGVFGTPEIEDNLFITLPVPYYSASAGPLNGGRVRRSRKSRRSRKR